MVLTIMIFLRKTFKLKDFVTDKHLEFISQVLKYGSLIIGSAYIMEMFIAWYSGVEYEMYTFLNARATGTFAVGFWIMVVCNAVLPQLFWFKKVRTNVIWLLIISIFINIGMWFERFVIMVSSLSQDFLPSSWVSYSPSLVDIGLYVGTFGLFSAGMLMFVRFIPIVAINEVKGISKLGYAKKTKGGSHE